ncbi:hypothetical protein CHS0354_015276 [Potamilus streckersoni]|uniref:G-protein coupled receptors family 2 profile 2 domain-containing protein n=1 Tax=Potamilus streckersoni TaxID=2493646 RepID=A0AAE0S050_9BIVA|nr:hypothetical protein CHS0354_015276 [Potamilus streckersoni]
MVPDIMTNTFLKEDCRYEMYRSSEVQHQKMISSAMLLMVVAMCLHRSKNYAFASSDLEFTPAIQNTAFYSSQGYDKITSTTKLYQDEPDRFPSNLGYITFSDMETILSMQRTLAYLDSIKDQSIRRATEIYLFYCPYNNICNFSLSLGFPSEGYPCCDACRCDVDCKREGNCCPNFVANFDELLRNVGSELECQYPSLHTSQNGARKNSGYYFIADCPPQNNLEETKACRRSGDSFMVSEEFDFSNVTPVTNMRNGLNYRNKFCASCHGIEKEDLHSWNVSLGCDKSFVFGTSIKQRIIDAINSKECSITFQPPQMSEYTPAKCTPLISRCNESGSWSQYDEIIERLCHSPFGSSFNSEYKNVFCMVCNNITMLNNRPVCSLNTGPGTFADLSFSALLNFRRQELKPLVSSQCPVEMVFDPYLMKCRQLYCSPTKTLDNDKCINILSQLDGASFETEITLFPLKTCPVTLVSEVAEQIIIWFESLLFDWTDSKYSICNIDTVYKVNHDYEENLLFEDDNNTWHSQILHSDLIFISSRWQFKVTGFYEYDRIYEMIQNITNSSIILQTRDSLNFTLLPRLIRFEQPVFDIVADLSKIYSSISNTNFNRNPLEVTQLISHAFPSISDNKTFIPYIVQSKRGVCFQRDADFKLILSILIPCTMMELDEQQFDWNYTEYGVYVPKLELHVNMTYFNVVPNPNGIALRICTQVYMTSQTVKGEAFYKNVSFEANAILSIICTAISLLCLILTLIVYIVFPKLQTVPGKNNMLLVVNLLIAQVMYLAFAFTPNSSGSICKAVGVLLHFFWLSAIFWMHLCTFHMLKVFIRLKKPNPKASTLINVVIYTIVVIAISAIFVLTNIIKALVESDMIEMGYGPEICYISGGKMVGFTFALPVGYVVVSNLVMFVVVIFKLRSLPSVEKNVKHDRKNTVIIAKLSSLTGITWIFGFLYVWTEEIVLSYFFIVLNASLGVFIMASFILNKRVIELIRSKYSPRSAITSRSHSRDTAHHSTYVVSDSLDMVHHSTDVGSDSRDTVRNPSHVPSDSRDMVHHSTDVGSDSHDMVHNSTDDESDMAQVSNI